MLVKNELKRRGESGVVTMDNKIQSIVRAGLVCNSQEYWEIRHQRDDWPRSSSWAMDIVVEEVPQGARVAIIGCGQGGEAFRLMKDRPDLDSILAFDSSPTAIEKATKINSYSNVEFQCVDLFQSKDKIPGAQFDFAISIQNFEHWPRSAHPEAIRNCWRLLKSGGKMFFTGVGVAWDLDQMNEGLMEYRGQRISIPNDFHYNNWSEQDVYDLFDLMKPYCVTFFRRRRQNRVVALAVK